MSLPSVWLIFSFSYIFFKMEQKDYIWKMPVFNMTPFCPAFRSHLPTLSQRCCPFSRHAESSHFVRPSRVFIVTTRFIIALCRLHFSDGHLKEWVLEGSFTTSAFLASLSCHTTKISLLMSPKTFYVLIPGAFPGHDSPLLPPGSYNNQWVFF